LRLLLYISFAALLGTCSSQPPLLDQILEVGELRVVTRDSPTAYVVSPDGPSGPEYDLTQAFADELGVKLVIEPVVSVSEILPYLIAGKAHMAAAGLSVTNSRREYVNFGHPYEMVDMHLIYKLGTGKPRSLDDVVGRSIEIVAGTSHADMLMSIQQLYPDLQWTENADVEVADLMAKVANDEVDFTISDSTEFNIQRHFYPDLRVALDLEIGEPLAWAFPIGKGDSLLSAADDFLIGIDRTGVLAQVKDRYYGHTDQFDYVGTRNFIRHFESRLPRYRSTFEEAGARFAIDWRLLAAIGYQESHWRSQAVSPTGVRGIMMLTEDTARYLGLESLPWARRSR
jgi:membrane-bound lytic murein transglycosylase F